MPKDDLNAWLKTADLELTSVVKQEVRQHLASIGSAKDLYGYAILPGESYHVHGMLAAYHCESDITEENADSTYFRYSVDEWAHYDHDAFPKSNALLEQRNAHFESLHVKADPDDYVMDETQIAHVDRLRQAIMAALVELKREGALGGDERFTVVWVPDSIDDIIFHSAKALNAIDVYDEFMSEFGADFLDMQEDEAEE